MADKAFCLKSATGHAGRLRPWPHWPIFGPRLLWPNGCMDQDATWYGGRPRSTRHCVRWGPSFPLQKRRHGSPPLFGPCLLWPNGRPSQQLLSTCQILFCAVFEYFFCFFACVRNFLFYGICITWRNKNSNEDSKCSNGLLTIMKTL